jgi:hypothetical protein
MRQKATQRDRLPTAQLVKPLNVVQINPPIVLTFTRQRVSTVVPPSVFNLPCSCADQIYSSHNFAAYFIPQQVNYYLHGWTCNRLGNTWVGFTSTCRPMEQTLASQLKMSTSRFKNWSRSRERYR